MLKDVADRSGMSKQRAPQDPAPAPAPAQELPETLFASARALPGIGPKLAQELGRLVGRPPGAEARRLDLLWHLPNGVISRALREDLTDAAEGERVTLEVRVLQHEAAARGRPYKVRCWTGTVFLHLVYFHARAPYLRTLLPLGELRVVSGVVSRFGPEWQIIHPELVTTSEHLAQGGELQPTYPLTEGLSQRIVGRAIRGALQDLPELPEWQDPAWLAERSWPSFAEALEQIHGPTSPSDIEADAPARRRLAFDELLANQLALNLVRGRETSEPGRAVRGDGRLRRAVLAALPFRLTRGQRRVLNEIDADMARPARMLRLLQGDVGSGKTLIALLAMLTAVEAGLQVVLMAPTEVLARQHADTFARLLAPAGLQPGLLTGRERGAERARILADLASGRASVAIGTHALFQEGVAFADLGLVVIDEQHRFGVNQRIELLAKARRGDLLVMTATPIPRTLVLSLYGDMALSELREKPPGRQPIDTRVLPQARLDQVLGAVARLLERGEQLYWVCPLIEGTEESEAATAIARHETLREHFGARVGLVHGRMQPREKDRAMAGFGGGNLRILVATTVIEVGVDVPGASVIVIEQAERFGLAQLHQLRGRVGRGSRPASCLLLYGEPLSAAGRERLEVMRRTEDGFQIAEADLKLRGPGEVLGTRQSGLPAFRLVDFAAHADLLPAANHDARRVLEQDPSLTGRRGLALRRLLQLLERQAAVAYLRSG